MVTPDEAAALSEMSTRAIYRLIEGGRLHFIEIESGSVLVCLNSIGASLQCSIRAPACGGEL
jgi:hypothetical protein